MTPEEKAAHAAEYKKRAEAFAKMDPEKEGYAQAEEDLARFLQQPFVAGNAHDKITAEHHKNAQAGMLAHEWTKEQQEAYEKAAKGE